VNPPFDKFCFKIQDISVGGLMGKLTDSGNGNVKSKPNFGFNHESLQPISNSYTLVS
jgi:hypothetical protein